MTDLQRRTLVAAVAIPVGTGIVYAGDALLAALLGMIAFLGAREFFNLVDSEGARPMQGLGAAFAAVIPLAVHGVRRGVVTSPVVIGVIMAIVLLAVAVWSRGPSGRPGMSAAATLYGAVYAGGTISFAYLLRYHEYTISAAAGTALLGLPLTVTWMCDTGAYAVGRRFGRHKLAPNVSPGKTVEGAIGGVVAAVIAGFLYTRFVLRPVAQLSAPGLWIVLFSSAVAVVAQIGDLAESVLKRSAGVKDSSNLIPGHGGVLDRFDSLYFVLPFSYLMLRYMLMPAPR